MNKKEQKARQQYIEDLALFGCALCGRRLYHDNKPGECFVFLMQDKTQVWCGQCADKLIANGTMRPIG